MKLTKEKFCWVSKQTKKGWSLELEIGEPQFKLEDLRLATTEDVKKLLKGIIVFVEMEKDEHIC